ncbi:WD repeat containing protein 44 [Purpureocillium lavendulum]|uniref:WD repeat containing protein 44 n=1 Tax=Purpureocillium lavendulum TaxID=1247861 RepID=A0AB34FLA0_9HYPO|nr:WD repeat containing protein 44 [Purpureocillium lavendulum]
MQSTESTTMTEPLSKVDSAVQGLSSSPPKEKGHRRQSSSAAGVMNINDLGKLLVAPPYTPHLPRHALLSFTRDAVKDTVRINPHVLTDGLPEKDKVEIELPVETQKTGWKINASPMTVDDPSILKIHLTKPPVKKIDLHFPLGMEVTARNMKGVTIKDALDAIHKAYKKRALPLTGCRKADDELDNPYLAGFEWDKEESWTRLIVHLAKQPTAGGGGGGGGKKKKNKKEEE